MGINQLSRLGTGWGIAVALAIVACSDGGEDSSSEELGYCDVAPIIDEYCVRCHSDPPDHFAPFPLTSWEATQEEYFGRPIFQRMETQVESGSMPLMLSDAEPPVEPLPEAEKELLLDWLGSGAPRGDSCEE